ncbi:hypothetical protein [Rhodanobacter sp. FW106-PBR-R2A-1-13]|uniref:hypothetical protein n=1 Tax=Rhodanobacter sp. FW106-PBR-R2A-1-13 TaxID=3454845 RepID=UPI0034E60ADA
MHYGVLVLVAIAPLLTIEPRGQQGADWWPPADWVVASFGLAVLLLFLAVDSAALGH